MKSLFITALFALAASVSFAQEPAATPAQESAVTAEFIIANIDALNATQMDVINILNGVTDKESADAAAPKIAALTQGMAEVQAKISKLHVPEDVMLEVQAHFQSKSAEMQNNVMEMQKTLARLLNAKPAAFYGSDKLFEAMNLKPAQEAAPTSDISFEDALAQAKDFVASLTEFNEVLKGVTDTASADAAAAKVTNISLHLKALTADGPAFAQASPEVAAKLNDAFGGSLEQVVRGASQELTQTLRDLSTKNFYNSAELVKAISAGQK